MKKAVSILLVITSVVWLSSFQPINKRLNFSLKNSTNLSLSNIKLELPGTAITYAYLAPNSQTKWISVKCAYSIGYLRFKDDKKREYIFQPKDNVGEKLILGGNLTYVIKRIDTVTKKVEMDHLFELR